MRELGIHPDNIDANPTGKPQDPAHPKGGPQVNGGKWDPKVDGVYGGDSPRTEPSTTSGKSYSAPEDGAGAPPAKTQRYDANGKFLGYY